MTVRELPVPDRPEVVACCAPPATEVLSEPDAATPAKQFRGADRPGPAAPGVAARQRRGRGLRLRPGRPVGKSQPTVSFHSASS
jgi:hypothetical protein